MKEPIEVSEIRKGDLIRVEWDATDEAREWRTDGSPLRHPAPPAKYYLLDRAKPAVELPLNDHHFGWLTAPGTSLARDRAAGEWFFGSVTISCSGVEGINRQKVTAWEPGTLVPTSALDELRAEITRSYAHPESGPAPTIRTKAITDFLAAVDASKP